MPKRIAERLSSLSISWLRKNDGFIPKQLGGGIASGAISWGSGEDMISIGYTTEINADEIMEEEGYIRVYYTHLDRETGEKENMDYKIRLTTTRCHFGGVRYWFVCPGCTHRTGVLYSVRKYYVCRHCGDIAYRSQRRSGMFKRKLISIPELEKAKSEIKRLFYNGNLTKKALHFLELERKSDRDNLLLSAWINKVSGSIYRNAGRGGESS